VGRRVKKLDLLLVDNMKSYVYILLNFYKGPSPFRQKVGCGREISMHSFTTQHSFKLRFLHNKQHTRRFKTCCRISAQYTT